MRLLWLTPEVPELAGTGGAIRSFELLRALARRGADLTVVGPAYPHQAESARRLAAEGVDLRLVRRPSRQPLEGLEALARDPGLTLAGLRDPWLGWQAGAFWTRIAPAVARCLAGDGFDAAVVEHDFAARWATHLPAGLPLGLATQNAGADYYARRANVTSGTAKLAARAEAARFRRYVRAALSRYGWACAVSEEDCRAFTALGCVVPDLIPNGVDVQRVAAVEPGGGTGDALLFTGTLSYAPNAEGILWFVRDVLPLVRRDRPAVTLTVVGRGPPPDVQSLARRPGIRVTGWVDDLVPYFRDAQVVVAPLRSGGGTKLKVIEALAAGRPLVATSVAAEGIDVRDGEDLLLADEPAAFARHVVALLGSADERERLARTGRQRVAARYDWRILGARLDFSLRRWLGHPER